MGIQVNIAEAKAKLSELVARAEAGEEVVLARNGEPVVTLTPKKKVQQTGRRQLGIWDHLNLQIPYDLFLKPDPELEALMDEPILPPAK